MRKLLPVIDIEISDSIDNIMYDAWRNINSKNSLEYLIIDPKQRFKGLIKDEVLAEAFNKIVNEFKDTFGVPDVEVEIWELRKDIAVLNSEMISEQDPSKITFIELAQERLDVLIKESEGGQKDGIDRLHHWICKQLHIHIDTKNISVRDFYNYVIAEEQALSKQQSE